MVSGFRDCAVPQEAMHVANKAKADPILSRLCEKNRWNKGMQWNTVSIQETVPAAKASGAPRTYCHRCFPPGRRPGRLGSAAGCASPGCQAAAAATQTRWQQDPWHHLHMQTDIHAEGAAEVAVSCRVVFHPFSLRLVPWLLQLSLTFRKPQRPDIMHVHRQSCSAQDAAGGAVKHKAVMITFCLYYHVG